MGAQKSIHAGNAKIDFNVDLTHKLCAALMLSPFRNSGSALSLIIGSLYIKHHNLFGRSEKLDVSWDKGLDESSVFIAYRKPRPEWLPQQSFTIQHSISPEIGVHGLPVENFSRSGSGGVNLCRFCIGLDLNEPASSHWSSKTSIKFEHVRPVNDDGRSISKDLDGFPVTCSGSCHDSMVVLKQESQFAKEYDCGFDRLSLQIEQGIPVLSKWLIFNRFKFLASKGISLGPAFLLTSLTGGSIVGDIAPYQAFAIGGLGSVRGYGEGAIGSGRSFLVANSELTFPLGMIPQQTRRYRGTTVSMVFLSSHFMHLLPKVRSVSNPSVSVVFWEQPLRAFIAKESDVSRCYFLGLWNRFVLWSSCSRDMANSATQKFEEKQRKVGERSHLRVPFVYEGNPSLRHGKPGNGIGLGYSLRFKSHYGNFQVDYAINAFHQERVSFSFGKLAS